MPGRLTKEELSPSSSCPPDRRVMRRFPFCSPSKNDEKGGERSKEGKNGESKEATNAYVSQKMRSPVALPKNEGASFASDPEPPGDD